MLEEFKIGHEQDDDVKTGVTVIIAPEHTTGGVSVRGGAPATRETDLLKSENLVSEVNAVVLSGGSAFGLEACCGVSDYLREKNIGFDSLGFKVPIVCGASLFDLNYGKFGFPDKNMGYKACENAIPDNFVSGSIGAGTGCTVGKALGAKLAKKGGLGCACLKIDDVEMAVIVAVNSLGDIYDFNNGKMIKGASIAGFKLGVFSLSEKAGKKIKPQSGNTTIACILTNAKLNKTQMNKLCDIAHDGLALAIRPVHTLFDGDSIFGLASNKTDADFTVLSINITRLMAEAVAKAVRKYD